MGRTNPTLPSNEVVRGPVARRTTASPSSSTTRRTPSRACGSPTRWRSCRAATAWRWSTGAAGAPLREVIEPESVAELAVWKRAAMATCRRRLAQRALDAALVEAGAAVRPAASLVVAATRASASPAHRDAAGLGALEAARRGESDVVDQLLRAGVDVDGAAAVKKPPYTALQLAVMGGRAAAARALLEARADPAVRAEGRQLIHLAALAPSPPELLQLLLMGGDDGAEQRVSATTSSGWTPLFLAVGADNAGHQDAAHARLHANGHGARPRLLHHAAACGAAAVARIATSLAQLPLDGRDSKGARRSTPPPPTAAPPSCAPPARREPDRAAAGRPRAARARRPRRGAACCWAPPRSSGAARRGGCCRLAAAGLG